MFEGDFSRSVSNHLDGLFRQRLVSLNVNLCRFLKCIELILFFSTICTLPSENLSGVIWWQVKRLMSCAAVFLPPRIRLVQSVFPSQHTCDSVQYTADRKASKQRYFPLETAEDFGRRVASPDSLKVPSTPHSEVGKLTNSVKGVSCRALKIDSITTMVTPDVALAVIYRCR